MTSAELRSKAGKMLSVSNIQRILSNPFYYGVFRYNGEVYEGTHEPIITKKGRGRTVSSETTSEVKVLRRLLNIGTQYKV